jgi:hypothetical protein
MSNDFIIANPIRIGGCYPWPYPYPLPLPRPRPRPRPQPLPETQPPVGGVCPLPPQ